jgi:hypothetical protein
MLKLPIKSDHRRKTIRIVLAVLFAGVLTASCSSSPSAAPPTTTQPQGQVAKGTTSPTSTTTTTTQPGALPECGSQRDPLDPNDSNPPAGSPANC